MNGVVIFQTNGTIAISPDEFIAANQQHAVNNAALALLLVDKGVADYAELKRYQLRATALVDQAYAARREEIIRELAEEGRTRING